MLFDNAKSQSRQLSHRQLPPPAPVPPKMEGYLITRATATKKYKDKLIADVNEAIN